MNPFEHTEIKSITDPIPPEPPPKWGGYVGIGIVCIAGILLVIAGWRSRHQWMSRLRLRVQKRPLDTLERELNALDPTVLKHQSPDFDRWWLLAEQVFVEKGWIPEGQRHLEEIDHCFRDQKLLDLEQRAVFRGLITLMEIHKYQGGLTEANRRLAVDRFRTAIGIMKAQ